MLRILHLVIMWRCAHILLCVQGILLRSVYTVCYSFATGDIYVYLESAIGANNMPVNRRELTL